jgi:galactokinase
METSANTVSDAQDEPESTASEGSDSILSVETNPEDAAVTLLRSDGEAVVRAQAPLELTVAPGRYELVVEHTDFRTARTPVNVAAGRRVVLVIELSNPPAFVTVEANVSGASVYVDERSGEPDGRTPWSNVVSPGQHHLWVEHEGYEATEVDFEIAPGEQRTIQVQLPRAGP